MRFGLTALMLLMLLSGCATTNDPSSVDETGYSTTSSLDPNQGTDIASKMISPVTHETR